MNAIKYIHVNLLDALRRTQRPSIKYIFLVIWVSLIRNGTHNKTPFNFMLVINETHKFSDVKHAPKY